MVDPLIPLVVMVGLGFMSLADKLIIAADRERKRCYELELARLQQTSVQANVAFFPALQEAQAPQQVVMRQYDHQGELLGEHAWTPGELPPEGQAQWRNYGDR